MTADAIEYNLACCGQIVGTDGYQHLVDCSNTMKDMLEMFSVSSPLFRE